MIQLHKVIKRYGDHTALDAVTLSLDAGECIVLIGPSGCGKTTLLKSINRMTDIDSGKITIDGVDIQSYEPEALRRSMGYCIQGIGLFPHFSVYDNIALVPRLIGWDETVIETRIHKLIEVSGISRASLQKFPKQLSGGEAQRVGVCRALAADPPILLMDEPFGAVDPLTRETLQHAFLDVQKEFKKTVVFVTHDIEEAITLADRIAIMNHGTIKCCAVPSDLGALLSDAFSKSFLGSEYPLKLLKRFRISDLIRHHATFEEQDYLASNHTMAPLKESTTLKEALSLLLKSNQSSLQVALEDGNVSTIRYHDIAAFLKEVSG